MQIVCVVCLFYISTHVNFISINIFLKTVQIAVCTLDFLRTGCLVFFL